MSWAWPSPQWSSISTMNAVVRDLEEYCSGGASRDSALSLDVLREKLGHLSAFQVHKSNFFHELCLNKHVTLEMVELVLDVHPHAVHSCSDRYHGRDMSRVLEEPDGAHPIHVACACEHCPNPVVELLVAQSNPMALGHFCRLNDYEIATNACECAEGFPLHYYLWRASNMEVGTVKKLIDARPASLTQDRDGLVECAPAHVLVSNPAVGTCCDVVRYLARFHPSSLKCINLFGQIPLHVACLSSHITSDVIRLLLDGWPNSTQQRDQSGSLPIHNLCENRGLDEAVKLDILRILLNADPDSIQAENGSGRSNGLPIHVASTCQSPAFNKILVDAYPDSLRIGDRNGNLPLHGACGIGTLETVKFLFKAEPNSIFARSRAGFYPLHRALETRGDHQTEVVHFLLKIDPDCASKSVPVPFGYLPLHLACLKRAKMSTLRVLFDANPCAAGYRIERTPGMHEDAITICRRAGNATGADFFERQVVDILLFSRGDGTPIHDALHNCVTLGVIKMIAKNYPGTVSARDANRNSPLHCACREGRFDVIDYLLGARPGLVSEANGDRKLPIELLFEADCDRNGLEYTDALWRLLVACPETVLGFQSTPAIRKNL